MADEKWYCERHPWLEFGHDTCPGAGMLLSSVLGIIEALGRLSDEEGAFTISRDEAGQVKVTIVTYEREAGVGRLPETDWFTYEHPTLMGAIVTAVADVWPECGGSA